MRSKPILHWGIKALNATPHTFSNLVIETVNHIRLTSVLKRRVPVALTLFVTNRCNAGCDHCFYWKEISRKRDELSIEEIGKLAKSLAGLRQVLLTGGEPFLRNDLVGICRRFADIGVKDFVIPTNGILTQRIAKYAEDILSDVKVGSLGINVSLDGTREVHDSIRNMAGCYDKAVETINNIIQLGQKHKNLNVNVLTTISKTNLDILADFIEQMNKLKVPLIFNVVRGTRYNAFGVDDHHKSDMNPKVEKNILSIEDVKRVLAIVTTSTNPFNFINWNIFQQLKLTYSVEIIEKEKRLFRCLAGYLDGVIYNNGDVALCEMTKPIGNLKDFNLDFRKLWWSKSANKMRKDSQKCSCIHGCNLLSSMQYDSASAKKIFQDFGSFFR